MGTGSEIVNFLNMEKLPSEREWIFKFSCISRKPELLKMRREYRKEHGLNISDKR